MTKERHDGSYMKGEERERKEEETGEEKKRREKGEMNTTISAQLVDSLHHHTKPNYNNHKLHHHLLGPQGSTDISSLTSLALSSFFSATVSLEPKEEDGRGMEGGGCGRSWHGGEAEEEEGRARRVGWRRDVEVAICGASSSFVLTTIVYISKGLPPLPSLPSHPSHPSHPSLSSRPSSYIHFT